MRAPIYGDDVRNDKFLQKDIDKAIEYLNELAEEAHAWTRPSATESTNRSRPARNPNGGGIYHLKEEDNLKAKIEMLTRELDVLKTKDLGMYKKPFTPFFDTNNLRWRNHPNFRLKFENQPPAQPPRSYPAPYHGPSSSRIPLEDTLHAFIEAQGKTNQKFLSLIRSLLKKTWRYNRAKCPN
jgi:hypothetical protein